MAKGFDKKKAAMMSSTMGEKATHEDVENVEKNIGKMQKGPLKKVWNKVTDIWDLYKSPDTPKWAKAASIGGLIYMVSPVDVVPDIIFPLGLLDDVFVIGLVFSQVAVLINAMKNKKSEANKERNSREELLKKINKPEIKERILKNVGYGTKNELELSKMNKMTV